MNTDLIKKLESLTGPDRDADWEVMQILDKVPSGAVRTSDDWYDVFREKRSDPRIKPTSIPNYTSSVDAAIALAERVLPDYHYGILPGFFSDKPYAGIIGVKGKGIDLLEATIMGGSNPAIALVIAILKAKEACK